MFIISAKQCRITAAQTISNIHPTIPGKWRRRNNEFVPVLLADEQVTGGSTASIKKALFSAENKLLQKTHKTFPSNILYNYFIIIFNRTGHTHHYSHTVASHVLCLHHPAYYLIVMRIFFFFKNSQRDIAHISSTFELCRRRPCRMWCNCSCLLSLHFFFCFVVVRSRFLRTNCQRTLEWRFSLCFCCRTCFLIVHCIVLNSRVLFGRRAWTVIIGWQRGHFTEWNGLFFGIHWKTSIWNDALLHVQHYLWLVPVVLVFVIKYVYIVWIEPRKLAILICYMFFII